MLRRGIQGGAVLREEGLVGRDDGGAVPMARRMRERAGSMPLMTSMSIEERYGQERFKMPRLRLRKAVNMSKLAKPDAAT